MSFFKFVSRLFDFFSNLFSNEFKSGIQPDGDIITAKGYRYYRVRESEIPKWVWKKFMRMEKKGASSGSFKGKKYRYIVQYAGGGMYDCWKRKRREKN